MPAAAIRGPAFRRRGCSGRPYLQGAEGLGEVSAAPSLALVSSLSALPAPPLLRLRPGSSPCRLPPALLPTRRFLSAEATSAVLLGSQVQSLAAELKSDSRRPREGGTALFVLGDSMHKASQRTQGVMDGRPTTAPPGAPLPAVVGRQERRRPGAQERTSEGPRATGGGRKRGAPREGPERACTTKQCGREPAAHQWLVSGLKATRLYLPQGREAELHAA